MFWKFDLNATSHVDKLLDKEEVTLQELMEEDDLLQECKAQNRRLVDFLCHPPCLEELVTLITHEPPLDMDEKVRFRYPNTACELLTSDLPQINDRLGGDEGLLNLLYGFLEQEPPLNPLLASFVSKTIGNLIARKTEQVISFLRTKTQFINLVLKHIDTSAMMDLLLRLISCVEPAQLRQEVLHWLNEEKVIQRLIALIGPNLDEERQSNASQALCDLIRLSRDQSSHLQEAPDPDPLLAALESQECVEQLLRNMFDGEQTASCIVHGTQILLTLLEPRRVCMEGLTDSFSQAFERSYVVSSSILQGIEPRLCDFHQLLLHPPTAASLLTTIGVLEEPLGNARLHGARLMAALLHTNTPRINQELCRLKTMDVLLDLFFKYTWNNFLHFQVELCIAAILAHSAHESQPATSDTENKGGTKEDTVSENFNIPKNDSLENIMVTHSGRLEVTLRRTSVDGEGLFYTTADKDMQNCHKKKAAAEHPSGYPLPLSSTEPFGGRLASDNILDPQLTPQDFKTSHPLNCLQDNQYTRNADTIHRESGQGKGRACLTSESTPAVSVVFSLAPAGAPDINTCAS